jgi:hypothetical protein
VRNLAYYTLSLLVALLLVLLVTSVVGGRHSAHPSPEAEAGLQEEPTIDELATSTGLPVYWLGETYRGLPIVNIQYVRDPGSPDGVFPPEERVSLIYASCKPGHPEGGGSTEGYCADGEGPTFVDITSEWLCLIPPSLLARGARDGPAIQIRGAQVQKTTSGSTHVFFGDSTVIISASEGDQVTLEALHSLEGLNLPGRAEAAAPGILLPPPADEAGCRTFVLPTPPPTGTVEPPTAEPPAVSDREEG